MAVTRPTPTVKLYPQLHNRFHVTRTPSNLYTKQSKVIHTKTTIGISTNDHSKRSASRIVNWASNESGELGRVQWSEVMEKRQRWDDLDIGMVVSLVGLHLLCGFAPFNFNWGALCVAVGLYVVTLLGITVSFHRHLSHKSFLIPKWLEYFLAYCGVQALQVK